MATVIADSAGYVLPSSGVASTTQFYLGPELSSGTACGVDALPNGRSSSGRQGGGPGYLYVRVPSLPNMKPYLDLSRQPSTNSPLVPTLQSPTQGDQVEHAESATGSRPFPQPA